MQASILAVVLLAASATAAAAQPPAGRAPGPEVPFELLSAQVVTFPEPRRIGAGPSALSMERALLVTVQARRAVYDGLPPDIEPFLYIGRRELRTFDIDRSGTPDLLRITFYTPDTAALEDRAPMVLTLEHGRPLREPEHYTRRQDLPRFSNDLMKDPR